MMLQNKSVKMPLFYYENNILTIVNMPDVSAFGEEATAVKLLVHKRHKYIFATV